VPLDPGYPAERLAFMIEDAGVPLILTQERLLDQLPIGATPAWCLDRDWHEVEHLDAGDLPNLAAPQNLAYCIYTSGSTGKPKGVSMQHSVLVHLILWHVDALPGTFCTLQFSSFSFDASFHEIFSTWLSGSCLVIPPPELNKDIDRLIAFMCDQQIERLFIPFRALEALASYANTSSKELTALRQVVTAGEQPQLSDALLTFLQREAQCTLFNLYGPSETHVVSWFAIDDYVLNDLPPIGYPIWNTQLYVLDSNLHPTPQGVIGELYIGGISLAHGYHDRPGLTAERFVPNPFAREPGTRLYRTGDLARWRADGAIEYVGRIDQQVKIRGFRVEPAEIEACLTRARGVREAIVVSRPGVFGKQLLAFVTSEDAWFTMSSEQEFVAGLKKHIRNTLPNYMWPAHVTCISSIPLTPNGKINKAALPTPEGSEGEYVPPSSDFERRIVGIWEEVLDIQRMSVTQNFFDAGGDSILAMQLVLKMKEGGFLNVTVGDVVRFPTIRELILQRRPQANGMEPIFVVRFSESKQRSPLFCLPPFSGTANCYIDLGRALGSMYDVIGFESHCISDFRSIEKSIPEAVSPYANYIDENYAGRPCCILGWSWGGILAHALADQLRGTIDIQLVAMVDVYSYYEQFEENVARLSFECASDVASELYAYIRRSPMRDLWEHLIDRLQPTEQRALVNYYGKRRAYWKLKVEPPTSEEYAMFTIFNRALVTRNYKFTSIEPDILSWVAADHGLGDRRPITWFSQAQRRPHKVVPSTTHDTILKSPAFQMSLSNEMSKRKR
jgi:amino acid adenylation domain-containing protein